MSGHTEHVFIPEIHPHIVSIFCLSMQSSSGRVYLTSAGLCSHAKKLTFLVSPRLLSLTRWLNVAFGLSKCWIFTHGLSV